MFLRLWLELIRQMSRLNIGGYKKERRSKKGKQINHTMFTYSFRGSYIDVDANIQEL